jgi:SAM-dependent methyltransferase
MKCYNCEEQSYSSKSYWEDRYEKKDGSSSHEWYFNFEKLQPILNNLITKESSILEIGCGDVPLLKDLSPHHEGNLQAIDFSSKVIDDLRLKLIPDEKVKYGTMDARELRFEDSFFDVVIDKGTMDAMLCDEGEGFANVYRIMAESCRVLRDSGPIMLISHVQVESEEFSEVMQNSILPALQEKKSVQWRIVAHVVEVEDESLGADRDDSGGESTAPVVYVISSSPRRFTRSMLSENTALEVPMKVLSYSS